MSRSHICIILFESLFVYVLWQPLWYSDKDFTRSIIKIKNRESTPTLLNNFNTSSQHEIIMRYIIILHTEFRVKHGMVP